MGENGYRRFSELVRVRARVARVIVADAEAALVEEGLRHFGVAAEEGRWIVLGVASDEDVGVESMLDARIAAVLARFARGAGRVGRREFEHAVAVYREWSNERIADAAVRAKLKQMVERRGWKPRRSGLLRSVRWFRRIPTD